MQNNHIKADFKEFLTIGCNVLILLCIPVHTLKFPVKTNLYFEVFFDPVTFLRLPGLRMRISKSHKIGEKKRKKQFSRNNIRKGKCKAYM